MKRMKKIFFNLLVFFARVVQMGRKKTKGMSQQGSQKAPENFSVACTIFW